MAGAPAQEEIDKPTGITYELTEAGLAAGLNAGLPSKP
jgi:hypothetical protein